MVSGLVSNAIKNFTLRKYLSLFFAQNVQKIDLNIDQEGFNCYNTRKK